MKTISFRLTDKQAHYLELIAERNMRTVEQLIWHTLPFGISCLSQEEISICVEKLPQDWSEKDKKDLEEVSSYSPNFSPEFYYKDKEVHIDYKENVLHDLRNTLIAKDKECDVAAELKALKEAKDKFKKAWNAKQEAKRQAEEKAMEEAATK